MSKKILFAVTVVALLFSCKEAKTTIKKTDKPLTVNKNYNFGLLPSHINNDAVIKFYNEWKQEYVTSNGCKEGAKRVLFDDLKHTVSEGIAYGMLASSMAEDEELLKSFYLYYNNHLDKNGLMNWKIDDTGKAVGTGAATDADIDVAYALLMAHKNTKNDYYLTEAKSIIDKMMETMVEKETFVLKAGDGWGGSNVTNPSYFDPGYFKTFAKVSGDDNWLKVADSCYDILFKSMNKETGLVPDWCRADGSTPADRVDKWAKFKGTRNFYDACRTPWRISRDYVWNGDQRALKYLNTVNSFVKKIGIENVVGGYELNGTPFREVHPIAFVGAFASGMMADKDQAYVDKCYQEVIDTENSNYFNETLKVVYLMTLSDMYIPY